MPFSGLLVVSPLTERASLFGEALEVATRSSSYILPGNGSICTPTTTQIGLKFLNDRITVFTSLASAQSSTRGCMEQLREG